MSKSSIWTPIAFALCALVFVVGCDQAQEAMKQAQDKANELAKNAKDSMDKATDLKPMDKSGGTSETPEGTASNNSTPPPLPAPEPEKPEVGYAKMVQRIGEALAHTPDDKIVFDAAALPEEWRAKVEVVDLSRCAITEAGYAELKKFPNLKKLLLASVQSITPADAAKIGECVTIEELNLQNSAITDAGMNALKPLVALRIVDASKCKFGDAGTAVIEHWVSLEELDIQENLAITGAKFAKQKCPPKLRVINARHTEFGKHGVAGLKSAAGLEVANLCGCAMIDQQAAHLGSIQTLQELWINDNPQLTKKGVTGIGGIAGLKALRMGSTGVRGYDLNFLTKLKSLTELDLINLGAPDDLVAKIIKNNPGIRLGR